MKSIFLIFSLFLSVNLCAQGIWSIEKCIDYAQENSLYIQQQNLLVKNSEIAIKESKHSKYPSLSAGAGLNFNNGRTINPTTNDFVNATLVSNNLNLSSSVTLYDGGLISSNIKNNELSKLIAINDADQQRRDLAINVARQYINVLLTKENIQVAELQLQATRDQLDRTQKMVNAGQTPRGDLLEIEAQIALNEQSIIAAQTNYQIAFIQLQQFMNTTETFDLQTVDGIATLDVDQITVDELLAKAISNHPKFKTFDLQQEQNEVNIKMAKAGKKPRLSAGASVGTNYSNQAKRVASTTIVQNTIPAIIDGQQVEFSTASPVPTLENTPYIPQVRDNLSYGIGFSLNVPIYDNYRTKASVQRAKINMERTLLSRDIEMQNLRLSVAQSLTQAQTAKKNYSAAQKSTEARLQAFNIAEKKFNIGKLSVFELTTNRSQLQQAQANELIAKYNYLLAQKMVEIYFENKL